MSAPPTPHQCFAGQSDLLRRPRQHDKGIEVRQGHRPTSFGGGLTPPPARRTEGLTITRTVPRKPPVRPGGEVVRPRHNERKPDPRSRELGRSSWRISSLISSAS